MSARPLAYGVLVRAVNGTVVFAEGEGKNPLFAALLGDQVWVHEARRKRLFQIATTSNKYLGLLVPGTAADVLIIHRQVPDVVLDFVATVDFAYDILRQILSDPFDAPTVVDHQARVAFISPVHETFFGLKRGEAIGRPVRSVIENTRLPEVVRTGKSEVGVVQKMRGSERVVTRRAIERDGRIVGAVGRVMFASPKNVAVLNQRINALEGELEFYRREAESIRRETYKITDIVGESEPITKLRKSISKVARLDLPILIMGESGVGKELVARAIHRAGRRSDAPLVAVNAAAMPASLVESELFGYEAGSFTGADRKGRRGKIEAASGGTLFLDEIGDMPLDVQAKLLRVLEDNMIERIGAVEPRKVDFRLICATNHDLPRLVAENRFRLDLFYRINTISLTVPSLNARLDDIPVLIDHFVTAFADRHNRSRPAIAPRVFDYLAAQDWPGNIRQLRHAVERALALNETGCLDIEDFADVPVEHFASISGRTAPRGSATTTRESNEQTQDELIHEALRRHRGNKKRAAQDLGMSRSSIYKRLEAQARSETLHEGTYSRPERPSPPAATTIREAVEHAQDHLIRDAMRRHAGNKKQVARELGISRSTLYKWLEVPRGPASLPTQEDGASLKAMRKRITARHVRRGYREKK